MVQRAGRGPLTLKDSPLVAVYTSAVAEGMESTTAEKKIDWKPITILGDSSSSER